MSNLPGYNFANLGQGWGMPSEMGASYPSLDINPLAPTPVLPKNAYGLETLGQSLSTAPAAAPESGGVMNWLFGNGTKDSPGNIGSLAGVGQSLFSGWLGMQQYGLAKQKLAESKRQFDLNYGAQKSLTNSQLEDRQRARVASNPGAYQSVGDYMNQYGVK